MSKAVIMTQPSSESMDLYNAYHLLPQHSNEKHAHQCEESQRHKHCHSSRRRRLLLPLIAIFLAICTIAAVHCLTDINLLGFLGDDNLVKRAVVNNGNGSAFTRRKLYLIVVFVGLFVVVILGICLSAWCCRGSFENPLCCPCYLCACCGGLACLECIGCGLCAEGAATEFGN